MNLNKLLNKKKRIGSILNNAKHVVLSNIAYTEQRNIGMILKVFNSLILKINKVGVETRVVFINMLINESCFMLSLIIFKLYISKILNLIFLIKMLYLRYLGFFIKIKPIP